MRKDDQTKCADVAQTDLASQFSPDIEKKRKRKEISEKRSFIDERRTDADFRKYVEADQQHEAIKGIEYVSSEGKLIKKFIDENRQYFERVKRQSFKLSNLGFPPDLSIVPGSIILICGATGNGKSTVGANLAFRAIEQGKIVAYISNEERAPDVFNRVTCLQNGWTYHKHNELSEFQIRKMQENIPVLGKMFKVVDNDSFPGIHSTTTLEGIKQILNDFHQNKTNPNVIIIDYYQKISRSVESPALERWRVLEDFCLFIDEYKKTSGAAIVVLAQCEKANTKHHDIVNRITGRKMIADISTTILEIRKDIENHATTWFVHKARFHSGGRFSTRYLRGKYLPFETEHPLHGITMDYKKKDESSHE